MKDKRTAALLAFFGGFLGLHKFYLQREGEGIGYLFLSLLGIRVLKLPLAALLGVIDCIRLLGMSMEDFDLKYNSDQAETSLPKTGKNKKPKPARTLSKREQRYRERQRRRRRDPEVVYDPFEDNRPARSSRKSNRPAEVQLPQRNKSSNRARRMDAQTKARLEEGIRHFKDYEYKPAIEAFEEVLKQDATNIAAHFNLACAYSAEEKTDRAFYHLDRAVALGFDDFERIRTHDALAYLRIQDDFIAFEDRGFRLAPDMPTAEATDGDPIAAKGTPAPELPPAAASDELLDQLTRLAALREKGLLTESEFATQKKRLLG